VLIKRTASTEAFIQLALPLRVSWTVDSLPPGQKGFVWYPNFEEISHNHPDLRNAERPFGVSRKRGRRVF